MTSAVIAELSYGTAAEKAFLERLAGGKAATMLLRNYIAAAEKRVAWGSIDKTEVLLYAELLLQEAATAEAAEAAAQVQRVWRAA
ncbi:hypothetical protein [Cupriavidus sp. a3]|uniref:hypothetical protein n=1 Tax=Cupriavidus sp. a3 TaxID=3242158 RepID=UPI003D9C4D2D